MQLDIVGIVETEIRDAAVHLLDNVIQASFENRDAA